MRHYSQMAVTMAPHPYLHKRKEHSIPRATPPLQLQHTAKKMCRRKSVNRTTFCGRIRTTSLTHTRTHTHAPPARYVVAHYWHVLNYPCVDADDGGTWALRRFSRARPRHDDSLPRQHNNQTRGSNSCVDDGAVAVWLKVSVCVAIIFSCVCGR